MISLLYIIVVFLLVLANGFFVASEFALVGVRHSRIELLAANGNRSARRLLGLLDSLNTYARAAFLSTGYSRLPVYGERRDEIVGLLFRKDLDMGRIPREGFDLKELVRPPAFIPATASLGEALRQMQSVRVHFVFVIDEHGGMEGILTLEDLLEEIVGEINDEYDEEAREQIRRDGKTYLLDGMLSVRDANQYLKLNLPEDAGYTTIAGFLMDCAGRVLQRGDRVEHEGDIFEIERVDKRRISRIRLIPRPNIKEEQLVSLPSLVSASVLAGQTATTLAVGRESLL